MVVSTKHLIIIVACALFVPLLHRRLGAVIRENYWLNFRNMDIWLQV